MLRKMYLVSPDYLKLSQAITVAPDCILRLKWLGKSRRQERNMAAKDESVKKKDTARHEHDKWVKARAKARRDYDKWFRVRANLHEADVERDR